VSGRNIQTLEGGEKIVLGNRTFHASYTPGHAIHHVCFFEYDSGIAFVGDAAGIRISDEFVYPATPPPDANLQQIDQSLDIIQAWRPEHLFLTHFGLLGNVDWHFSDFRDRLSRWSEFVLSSLDRPGDDTLRAAEFSEMVRSELFATLKPGDAAWHEKLISARQNWYGLAQYWRRREKSNPKSVT
jgi:glyoxylase-like metal-dependent hydrolase (beta-lactamase superfamily II)